VGKTTLVARVIEHLSMSGLRVGALKHSSHGFQMDREGKDTFRFREAGAYAVGISSANERAVITSTAEPTSLADLAAALPADLDLIVVEGYRNENAPTVEVHRGDRVLMSRAGGFDNLIAIVTDAAGTTADADGDHPLADVPEQVTLLDLNDVPGLCAWLRSRLA